MQFNTLTLTLQNFITALSGAYSRIQGSASTLLGILVGIEVVLLGLWTALGGGDNLCHSAMSTKEPAIYVGRAA